MKKEKFNELVASIKEAVAISKGEIEPAETVVIPSPKAIREKLNLSQDEFAEFVGVRVATLRNWEQGRRRIPSTAKTLLRIAERPPRRYFGVGQHLIFSIRFV